MIQTYQYQKSIIGAHGYVGRRIHIKNSTLMHVLKKTKKDHQYQIDLSGETQVATVIYL